MSQIDPTKLNYREVLGMESIREMLRSIFSNPLLKGVLSGLVSMHGWLFDPRGDLITAVTALVVFDTMTGFLKALKAHNVSSSGFFRFVTKFIVYFILLGTAAIIDKVMPTDMFVSALALMAGFLVLTESLSIMENIAGMGYSVPSKLVKFLRLAKMEE